MPTKLKPVTALAAFSLAIFALGAGLAATTASLAQEDEGPMVITPHPQGPRAMPPQTYAPPPQAPYGGPPPSSYAPPPGAPSAYAPRPAGPAAPYPGPSPYGQGPQPSTAYNNDGPGVPYQPVPENGAPPSGAYVPPEAQSQGTFSAQEIKEAGHRFFGSVSSGLAQAIEYTFQKAGRPNGYILGEEAGGAIVAGLRYGEGTLYTKDAGEHMVYWQGPSLGYDFGAEGSKTMVLVYDLRSPSEIYSTFAGVDGSAYLVGGIGVTFLARNHVILAPIRSGLGLRLGANVGYLKYTRQPTWNPF